MIYQLPAGLEGHAEHHRPSRAPHYDVVVVGARAAGASTALLLARAGVRVLVVERAGYGSDVLSSHALLSGGVDQLQRWGILERISTSTPPIRSSVFEFGGELLPIDHRNQPLYAPRRTVLDAMLVDAARDAGAEVRFETRVLGVLRDESGRVRGVRVEGGNGQAYHVTADLLVGADGLRSLVARKVDAPVTRRGASHLASIYAYVRDAELPSDEYRFAYGDRVIGGSIPTNDDAHCVFVSMSPTDFRSGIQLDVATALHRLLDRVSPTIAAGARSGSVVGPFRSFPGHPGQFRAAHGPGWALVGDAGYFKDPSAAHGLSDAFRDAELLANAVQTGDLDGYETLRDRLSMPLFEHIERLASLEWDPSGARSILIDMAIAMADESRELQVHRDAVDECVG